MNFYDYTFGVCIPPLGSLLILISWHWNCPKKVIIDSRDKVAGPTTCKKIGYTMEESGYNALSSLHKLFRNRLDECKGMRIVNKVIADWLIHPQNVRFQNVRFQNVWNVSFTKLQVYKMSGFKTSGFKTSVCKKTSIYILYLWLVEIRRLCCSQVCRQRDGRVLFSILEGFFAIFHHNR